jgi:hypothetical protein
VGTGVDRRGRMYCIVGRSRVDGGQGVIKRCRLSWRANSALVYEPKREGGGEWRGVAGSQPMSTAMHMEPK